MALPACIVHEQSLFVKGAGSDRDEGSPGYRPKLNCFRDNLAITFRSAHREWQWPGLVPATTHETVCLLNSGSDLMLSSAIVRKLVSQTLKPFVEIGCIVYRHHCSVSESGNQVAGVAALAMKRGKSGFHRLLAAWLSAV
jgi:hypothetical protein